MVVATGHLGGFDVTVALDGTAALQEHAVRPFVGGRLASLARRHHVPGAQLAIHHVSTQDHQHRLRGAPLCDSTRDQHRLRGAPLCAGCTVAVEFGELEHGTRRRVTPGTAFPVGSITKTFTATTAMILVADGDLELDEPLGEYLPELRDLGDRLTLRQVLSHTGGLPAGPDSEDVRTATVRRYVLDHCRSAELVLPPGTGFSYSNLGFVLVGQLIAEITGMSWWDAVTSILLRPLGIEPAVIDGLGLAATGRPLATGHSVNPESGRTRPVRQSLAPAEAPAGGLAMSALDLVALGRLHLTDRPGLLPASQLAQMRQPVPAADPFGLADGWGLGLAMFEQAGFAPAGAASAPAGATWVGHDGNVDGTACYLRIDPVGGWVIALTSNANTGLGLWQDLLAELAGTDLPLAPPRIPVPPAETAAPPAGCVGRYVNSDMEYVVTMRNGVLHLSVDDAPFVRLTCHPGLVFAHRDPVSGRPVIGGRFVLDARTGRVNALQIGGRLARRLTRLGRETERRLIA